MRRPPASFYARTGTTVADLWTLLHPPYTAWHLAYVAIGASLAPDLDWLCLLGTLAAFFFGTGVAAHALDEWKTRPLGTGLRDRTLLVLGIGGLMAGVGVAAIGVFVISPWVLGWAAAGVLLAAGYALEWDRRLHSNLGFALAWGAFPVWVGYWAQTESLDISALLVGVFATLLSLTQRSLSTNARFVRRTAVTVAVSIDDDAWSREKLQDTWEWPLKLLAIAVVVLALGLLVIHA